MAAARYWRIVSLDSYGVASLQLSEFGLFDGATRRDTGAVITSTVAPAAGSLSALNDGGFGTSVTFNAAQFRLPGFAIEWDLGSSLEVNVVRLATVSNATAPMVFTIQYQDGAGQWVTERFVQGVKPSNGALGLNINFFADDRLAQVSLLLHMDGTNGSTTFTDSSPASNGAPTVSGVIISTAQSRFGGASAQSTSGTAQLEYPTSSNFRWFDTATLEFWIRFSSFPSSAQFMASSAARFLSINSSGVLSGNGWISVSQTATLQLNTWHHVAISMYRSFVMFFVDGVEMGSISGVIGSNPTEQFGVFNVPTRPDLPSLSNAFIDELRFTQGVARYATNFTPPNAPFPDAPDPGSGDPIPLRTSPTASPRSISYYRVPDPTTFSTRAPLSFDQEDAGRFRIVGTVKEVAVPSNAPLRRRVLLIDEVSRRTIRETWSDAATGVYVFNQIAGAPRRYTVVSYDHTGQYRAVIADTLEAEPMT